MGDDIFQLLKRLDIFLSTDFLPKLLMNLITLTNMSITKQNS